MIVYIILLILLGICLNLFICAALCPYSKICDCITTFLIDFPAFKAFRYIIQHAKEWNLEQNNIWTVGKYVIVKKQDQSFFIYKGDSLVTCCNKYFHKYVYQTLCTILNDKK